MATGRQLRTRIKSITGLRKITKAMNMIAAAQVRKSQLHLDNARAFSRAVIDIWPEPVKDASNVNTLLVVPFVADRGLCGAANSSIIRKAKKNIDAAVSGGAAKDVKIVVLGEKGRGGMERAYKKYFAAAMCELTKIRTGMTFKQSSELTNYILAQQFDAGYMMYNRFKNMMVYNQIETPVLNYEKALEAGKFDDYEMEGDAEILKNLYEYRMATRVYLHQAESDCSEQSARSTAMAGSSKSASDILSALQLLYNRTRQSKITQELMEIIGGMTGAKKDKGDGDGVDEEAMTAMLRPIFKAQVPKKFPDYTPMPGTLAQRMYKAHVNTTESTNAIKARLTAFAKQYEGQRGF
jgi:ATP synthase F1 gamma subunit